MQSLENKGAKRKKWLTNKDNSFKAKEDADSYKERYSAS
jgi:hypothetical protein